MRGVAFWNSLANKPSIMTESIMTNFEQSVIGAIAQVYPQVYSHKYIFFIYLKASTAGCKGWGYHISVQMMPCFAQI